MRSHRTQQLTADCRYTTLLLPFTLLPLLLRFCLAAAEWH